MKEKYQFVHVYSNIESIIIFTSLPTVQVQMYFIWNIKKQWFYDHMERDWTVSLLCIWICWVTK